MTEPTRVQVTGPLGPYSVGFCDELATLGYRPLSARDQVRLMAHLSRWLEGQRLGAGELTPQRLEQFVRARRRARYTSRLTDRALTQLVDYLRRLDVVPAAPTQVARTAAEQLVERYERYLIHERGLAPGTISHYKAFARVFLAEHSHQGECNLSDLRPGDVTEFVLHECRGGSVASAKNLVASLRSLLRFLYLNDFTAMELAAAVPKVPTWRAAELARPLPAKHVAQLMDSCDRRTALGRRDYAILTLLSRLGLRAGEVAALQLDDINWRGGEIVIRGKGRRQERLPLPVDVGEALIGYLRRGRPGVCCRQLFVRFLAPHHGLSSAAVTTVVRSACDRAGLPRVGAHRLRHAAATRMLSSGASMSEIAQVLRHRSLVTTAIYAKVDRIALRGLAQPWPGAPHD